MNQIVSFLSISFYPISLFLLFFRFPPSGSLLPSPMPLPVLRSFLLLMVLVHVLKYSTHRERPDQSDFLSFPSGHSATVWFLVSTYQYHPIIVMWAVAVSLSRIIEKKHYPSDVLVGACLGLFFGSQVTPHLRF